MNRLREEGRRLKREGKLRGAEEAFARARKARAAYRGLCRESSFCIFSTTSAKLAGLANTMRTASRAWTLTYRPAAENLRGAAWAGQTAGCGGDHCAALAGRDTAPFAYREAIGVMGPGALPARCIEVQKWLFHEEMDGEDRAPEKAPLCLPHPSPREKATSVPRCSGQHLKSGRC